MKSKSASCDREPVARFETICKDTLASYNEVVANAICLADIVHEAVDVNGNVPPKLKCLICLSTVYEPRYCKMCETALYCLACTKKIGDKCSQCQRATRFVHPSRITLQFMEEIQLKCVKTACAKSHKTIRYGDLCSSEHKQVC